jgi:hypothetical protein
VSIGTPRSGRALRVRQPQDISGDALRRMRVRAPLASARTGGGVRRTMMKGLAARSDDWAATFATEVRNAQSVAAEAERSAAVSEHNEEQQIARGRSMFFEDLAEALRRDVDAFVAIVATPGLRIIGEPPAVSVRADDAVGSHLLLTLGDDAIAVRTLTARGRSESFHRLGTRASGVCVQRGSDNLTAPEFAEHILRDWLRIVVAA